MADIVVKINQSAVAKLQADMAKALVMTGTEILSRERNDAIIPMDTGNLQNESTYVDDSQAAECKVAIVTDAPQARRLYYHPEYNFRHDKNANAQGEWWEPWISGRRKSDPPKIFAAFLKRLAGGLIK